MLKIPFWITPLLCFKRGRGFLNQFWRSFRETNLQTKTFAQVSTWKIYPVYRRLLTTDTGQPTSLFLALKNGTSTLNTA